MSQHEPLAVHVTRIEMDDRTAAWTEPLRDALARVLAVLHQRMIANAVEVLGIDCGCLVCFEDVPPP